MSSIWESVNGIFTSVYDRLPALRQEAREVERVIIREVDSMNRLAGRQFVRIAGLSGAVAVIMSAYGAHAFLQRSDDTKLKEVFDSGNKMHLFHSVALLGVPLTRKPALVGTLMTGGIVLFSGTCYYHALSGDTRIRKLTPYGGFLLILAWLAMVL